MVELGYDGIVVVRLENRSPANLRIVRPTDGIGHIQSNSNRLTLVIGEDSKIVAAA